MTWGKSLFVLLFLCQSAQASLGFGRFYSRISSGGEFSHFKGDFIDLETITAAGEEPGFRVSYRPVNCQTESRPSLTQCSYRRWNTSKTVTVFDTSKWNVYSCRKEKFVETLFARGRAVIYDTSADFKAALIATYTLTGTLLENGTPVPYLGEVSGPDCVLFDFP
jgi:hypothetical protein